MSSFFKLTLSWGGVFAFFFLSACGSQSCSLKGDQNAQVFENWNAKNNPALFPNRNFETRLNSLPTRGAREKKAWADSYWPNFDGGIAQRWRSLYIYDINYPVYYEQQIRSMNLRDLGELSPAEKFDVFRGRFDFPTVFKLRSGVDFSDLSWAGICHGWAAAALKFEEPKPVVLRGPSGIEVPFASSDVKALLEYYQGEVAEPDSHFVGERCNGVSRDGDVRAQSACSDLNPGAFHIALANFLGRDRTGFIADLDAGVGVWNYPLHGYESSFVRTQGPTAGAAPGTVQKAIVKTRIFHPALGRPFTMAYADNASFYQEETRDYQYRLELNARGEIIGGAWEVDDYPDFIWIQEEASFAGEFLGLADIYKASMAAPNEPVRW